MLKIISVLIFLMFFFSTVEASWQEQMHQWVHHVEDREYILKVVVGDLTGNLSQDVVIVFHKGAKDSMIALINNGGVYTPITFDTLSGDFLSAEDFSHIEDLQISRGEILAYLPFDVSRLVPRLYGTHSTLLRFRYLENRIKLTELVTIGKVAPTPDSRKAHLFYNALKGEIFYRYLAVDEQVGTSRRYYFHRYSRVIASPVKRELNMDANKDKWVFIAKSHVLENSPLGSPITYGFERWKDNRDLSATYYVAYDDQNIYLLVDVVDDVVRQNFTGDAALRGDHVELWFGDEENNRFQIALLPGNFVDTKAESMLWFFKTRAINNTPLDTIEVVSSLSKTGYIIEAKIPLFVLEKESVHEITRFTIAISDSDMTDRQEKLLASSSLVWGEASSLGTIIWKSP